MKDATNKGLKDVGYLALYLVLWTIMAGAASLFGRLLFTVVQLSGYTTLFWLAALGRYGEGHPKRDYLCILGWMLVPLLGPTRVFLACGTGLRVWCEGKVLHFRKAPKGK